MSQAFRLKGLKEQRGKLRNEIQKLGEKITKEERGLSPEEQATFDKLKQDLATIGQQISQAQADVTAIEAALAQDAADTPPDPAPSPDAPPPEPAQNSRRIPGKQDRDTRPRGWDGADVAGRIADLKLARQAWARKQYGLPLTRAHVEACKRTGVNPKARELVIRLGPVATRADRMKTRALTVTTSGGGYLIAEDYSYELESKLVDFSNVRGVCRELQTADGADLPWPTEDDTSNTGELLAINTEVAYADPTFGSVTFGAYKFSSKGILVPNELMQDSAFDVDAMVFGEAGTRIGRIQATYFTTGSGSSQPKGVVTCASAGLTTASATAFTAAELTRLAHTVDPAYRKSGSCGYMMKDDVVAYALLLTDSNGRPLLRESFREGTGGGDGSGLMCNGFPIHVNQAMTGLTSNLPVTATKHVLFGDFSKFIIRDAGSVRLRRLDERWAEKDQTGFIGFLRSDSNCVNTAAIKYMLQA